MSYTLKYDHPHFPEGMEFNVGNLGRVENKGSMEIDEEMERLFLMSNGITLEDAFKGNAVASISGSSALDKSEVDYILSTFTPPEVEEPAIEEPPIFQSQEPKHEGGEE